jgi:hypothetical protein
MNLEEARNNLGKDVYFYHVLSGRIILNNFESISNIEISKHNEITMRCHNEIIYVSECFLSIDEAIAQFKTNIKEIISYKERQ